MPAVPPCIANLDAVRSQLKALERFQNDPLLWRPLLETLAAEALYNRSADDEGPDSCCRRVVLLNNGPDRPPVPVIPNEVVVKIEDGALSDQVGQILAKFGFIIEDKLGEDGRAVRRFSSSRRSPNLVGALEELNAVDGVEAVPNVLRAMNVVTKSKSGAEPACCVPELPNYEAGENGERDPLVVVVDTGLFADGHGNGLLNHVDGEPDPRVGHNGYLNLSAGHGTFIAGVIRQVCRNARVHAVQAIGPAGFATDSEIAAGIRDAAGHIHRSGQHGVINLSLGGEAYDGKRPLEIEEALDELPPCVAVVAAAGNRKTHLDFYPAAFSEDEDKSVVAVASLDHEGNPSAWSNNGEFVTFSAVGEGIVSTYVKGDEYPGTGADDDPYDPDPDSWTGPKPWAVWTGTSFATPQVAARLAEIIADKHAKCDGGENAACAEAAIDALKAEIAGDTATIDNFGLPLKRPDSLMVVERPVPHP